MMINDKSPITGQNCEQTHDPMREWWFITETIGRWALTETVLENGFGQGNAYESSLIKLNEQQTDRLLAYAASKIWEAARRQQNRPFFFSKEVLESSYSSFETLRQRNQLWSPEDLWQELENFTFEQKAMRTLANFVLAEAEIGDGVLLPLSLRTYPGEYSSARGVDQTGPWGLFFAAVGKEGPLQIRYLLDLDLIRSADVSAIQTKIHITPKGYALTERIRTGATNAIRKAFMICRFIPEMDELYDSHYKPVGVHPDVNCSIERVKDIHHVDKIDDKIIKMIEESSIVIVDLTKQNFNVAFEAGYAMALGKPIVWTLRKDSEELKLPFDIQSHNILQYELDKLEEFAENLRYRILAAIAKAQGNTPGGIKPIF